jgi:hypothetical protein
MAIRDLSRLYVSQSFNRLIQIDPNDSKTALYGTGSSISGFSVSGSIETNKEITFNNSSSTQSVFYETGSDRLAIRQVGETSHSFINTVEFGGTDPVDPPILGDTAGYGTIYVNTGSNDIFMWI